MATPIGKSRGACSTAHGILPTKGKAPVERVEATERDRDREGSELQRECAKRERTQLTKRDKVYCIIMSDLQEAEIHKQGKTSL
jgi:hypothetical protein